MVSAKENILKRIREALINTVPLPFPNSEGNSSVYVTNTEDSAIAFAETFTSIQGKFAFCNDMADFKTQFLQLASEQNWKKIFCREDDLNNTLLELNITAFDDLKNCDVSITGCAYLIARTGSIVMDTAKQSGRTVSVYAPIHVCVGYTNQLVPDVYDALKDLKEKHGEHIPSFITFASGPSRTADIEKTLVTGVHGPKEVYCFLIQQAL